MKRRVAVLMGGTSEERPVSLKSGQAVAAALRECGYDVVDIDLKAEDIEPVKEARPDVAFIALHGAFGEDGGVQAMLDDAGIAYCGSDAHASRAAMDKMAAKCFFITHDVPTPPFRLVTATQEWSAVAEAASDITLPMVVKPLRQGSSIGVTIIHTMDEAVAALRDAFKFGHQALLERYIRGREFTVGVLGDEALPVIELRPHQAFFNYEAKYSDKSTEYILEPDIDGDAYGHLQDLALAAHNALGCRHMSRVDMMIEEDGCPYVLEVNTIPGFTERSLLPQAAKARGIAFPDLCDLLVQMAVVDRSAKAPAPPPINRLPSENPVRDMLDA